MRQSLSDGVALAWSRLGRPRTLLVAAVAMGCVLADGGWERARAASVAADRVLTGAAFGLVLPLLAYHVIREVTAQRRLDQAVLEAARHGANRHWAAIGLLGTATIWLAILCGLIAGAGVVTARGFADPQLGSDLATSVWIGALAGGSYAWFFGFGTSLGRRGGGSFVVLVLDWFLGVSSSAVAVPWPRAHLRNLLGAEPILGLSQGAALAVLVGLVVVYSSLALWRTPR